MARRNRDRDGGREAGYDPQPTQREPARGGLRQTQRVVSAQALPINRGMPSIYADLLDIDMSAFRASDDRAPSSSGANRPGDNLARPGRIIERRYNPDATGPSRRTERLPVKGLIKPAAQITTAQTIKPNLVNAVSPASKLQLQAMPSPKVRTEASRETCKPRPKNNKGSGGSRAFVPWCDRKR